MMGAQIFKVALPRAAAARSPNSAPLGWTSVRNCAKPATLPPKKPSKD